MIALPFIANTLVGFVVGLLVARFLGPAEYGRFAIAMSAGIVIQTLAFDWLRLSATRFTTPGIVDQGRPVAATLNLLFGGLAALAALAVAAIWALPTALGVDRLTASLAVGVGLANGVYDFAGAKLRARFRDRPYRMLVIARTAFSLVLMVGVAAVTGSATMTLAAAAATLLLSSFVPQGEVFEAAGGYHVARFGLVRRFAAYAFPIVLANALIQGAPFLNRSLASQTLGFAAAGQLALAYDVGLRIFAAIGSAADALLFQLAVRAEAEGGHEAARRQAGENIVWIVVILAPAIVGAFLVLPSFESLVVPETFRGAFSRYFALQLPAFFAFALSMYCVGPLFQIAHRTGPVIAGGAATLAVNALAASLLPKGSDASSFAVAQSLGSVAGLAAVAFLAARVAPVRVPWRELVRAAVACATMAGAVWPFTRMAPGVVALAVQSTVGAGVYIVAALALDLGGLRARLRERIARSPTAEPKPPPPEHDDLAA